MINSLHLLGLWAPISGRSRKPIRFPSRSHRPLASHAARLASQTRARPAEGCPKLSSSPAVARGRSARGGLQFPECPAATGGAGECPQPIKGSPGAAGERQVEPGRGWARGQVPGTRPGARWLGGSALRAGRAVGRRPRGRDRAGAGTAAACAVPGAPAARSPGRT